MSVYTRITETQTKELGRRGFLLSTSGLLLGSHLLPRTSLGAESGFGAIAPHGPASKYTPTVKMAFVRRKGEYGMWWPGAVYDGEAALKKYRELAKQTGQELGIRLQIRDTPIYSPEEADAWIAQAKEEKPDGLVVALLDRQKHAWPTAYKAIDSKLPTVIFAPLGTAFTTNTWKIAKSKGLFVCSTDDFNQVVYGMKMLKAAAKLRETRYIVLMGKDRKDDVINHFGTKTRHVPAETFLNDYRKMDFTDEIRQIAKEYMQSATGISGPTEEDVMNGVKSYAVARDLLEREEGDAITMDCLGALAREKISLPCISWSHMLDNGIPAACEADLGAAVTHALVQYLFDRPGFQQDPVPETARDCLIGAHCTCPTKLNGFSAPPEPYDLTHHHGNRDAVPRPVWRVGQRMTSAIVQLSGDEKAPRLIVSSGKVVENLSVPPAGGCVVSVMVEFDNVDDYLGYPGFHQIFFYGDYKKELRAYCNLYNIEPVVV